MAADGGGQTASRRRLGRWLRSLRVEAGKTAVEAAAALQCSQSKISRLESGKGIPRQRDVRDLLAFYGVVDAELVERLLDLAERGSRTRAWSEDHKEAVADVPDHLMRLIALEEDVRVLRSFQPELVPGLLQTEAYLREVIGQMEALSPTQAARRIDFRLERQRVFLNRSELPLFQIVIAQVVLERSFVGADVLADQLRWLAQATADWLELCILPSDTMLREAIGGSFVVMRFAEGEEDLVYLEGREGGEYLESVAVVDRYEAVFETLRERSWSDAESRAWLQGRLAD